MIKIKVPATSANVSVGFDTLGLAVAIYSTFIFSESSSKLEITGTDSKFQNANNLVYKAFVRGCEYLEQPVPNVKIEIDSDVPVSRGLGSSAVCIVAGLKAASEWFGGKLSDDELVVLATKMEGHPDNVVPAILGGLQLSFLDDNNHPQLVSYQVSDNLNFVTLIPDYQVSTDEAREALPTSLSYQDTVHQVSHFGMLIHGIENGNLNELRMGMDDRMHEPYRAKLIPDYSTVQELVKNFNGALYISGSGSTMMAVLSNSEDSNQLIGAAKRKFPNWRVESVMIDNAGVTSEVSNRGKVLHR
ncbi:homoserine kinase [Lentilactobacillus curieae]|uniref:Homoserine kinase n=1 Tax=Lentilactobacillus curieae TaxID=1138822 RepID=A0A1S6QHW3_9LACO|nr:homoserine kinase [Lentilactobacillus curieae]AQW21193.1 homoserine kinase [Lentilactobacillus curieae]